MKDLIEIVKANGVFKTNCPKCGAPLGKHPALSRYADIKICSSCGLREAFIGREKFTCEKSIRDLDWEYGRFVLLWAITKVLEWGTDKVLNMSNDDIEEKYQAEVKRQSEIKNGFCMYTPESVKAMCKCARELACKNFDELFIKMEQAEIFNSHPIGWNRMSEIATRAIDRLKDDLYEDDFKDFVEELDLDESEMEYFEIKIEEDDE